MVAAVGLVVRIRRRRAAESSSTLCAVPEQILGLAAEREPVVVLTAPWHERDAQSLVERLGAPVSRRRPTPRTTSCGSTASLASGSRGLAERGRRLAASPRAAGRRTCSRRATTSDRHRGVPRTVAQRPRALGRERGRDRRRRRAGRLRPRLRGPARSAGARRHARAGGRRPAPLLQTPVELVLPAHGAPMDRAALERALSQEATGRGRGGRGHGSWR